MFSKISLFLFFISLSFFVWAVSPETDDIKEKTEVLVHFDISDPDIVLPLDHDVKDLIVKCNSSAFVPEAKLSKSGFKFSGWTSDGIYGYARGNVIQVGTEDVTYKPVFVDTSDDVRYTVTYYAEFEGEVIDTSEILPKEKYRKNSLVEVEFLSLLNNKAKHRGWGFDGHVFYQQKFIMPAKNVVLTAIWHYVRNLIYDTGDIEGVVGGQTSTIPIMEGSVKQLTDETRLSRKGYEIIGWHCSYDDKDYNFYDKYVMPDSDVHFYAIWKPLEYKIVFNPGVKGVSSIKIPGKTGTEITIPEINCEKKGYTFNGWQFEDNKLYMPGEEFYIEGEIPGKGYSFKAFWTKDE